MTSLAQKRIAELVVGLKGLFDVDAFIESGTYYGETAIWAARQFKHVETIELSAELHQQARVTLAAHSNIVAHQGHSESLFKDLQTRLTHPAVFWIDAHWSAGVTAGSGHECPLLDELHAITNAPVTHFLFIDDARLFLAPPPWPHRLEQWPTISDIVHIFDGSPHSFYVVVVDDVIVAVPEHARDATSRFCQIMSTEELRAAFIPKAAPNAAPHAWRRLRRLFSRG